MKKITKILLIFFINIILFAYFNISYATPEEANYLEEQSSFLQSNKEDNNTVMKIAKSDWSYIFGLGDSFINKGKAEMHSENNETIYEDKIRTNASNIFNILLAIGVVLTVIIGGVLGIKFMVASAEDKAKIKEALIPYILGCVVIYGAFGIWSLIVNILGKM